MEIEAPESGTLLHIKVKEGEGVPGNAHLLYRGKRRRSAGEGGAGS